MTVGIKAINRQLSPLHCAFRTLQSLPLPDRNVLTLHPEHEDGIRDFVLNYVFNDQRMFECASSFSDADGFNGYDESIKALFRSTANHEVLARRGVVNLWGVPPFQDPFWLGNLTEIRSLLEQLGLKVNSFFTLEDTAKAIALAGIAQFNIIVSHVYGISAGIVAEEVYRTNFISTPLPIGPTATDAFINAIGKALKIKSTLVELVISREKSRYQRAIHPYSGHSVFTQHVPVVVVGDANYSVALTRFIADDLGWDPLLTICTDRLSQEEQERITMSLSRLKSGHVAKLYFESVDYNVHDLIRQSVTSYRRALQNRFPVLIVGSSLEKKLADELKAGHLSISSPASDRLVINRCYSGYNGGVRLIEDLAAIYQNSKTN